MERAPCFINWRKAPKIRQMEGLETTILTGLHREEMMMVLNATIPGHKVPQHSHPHEQIGIVYRGKAALKIGEEERVVKQGDFTAFPQTCCTVTCASETSHLSCWTFSILCAKISFKSCEKQRPKPQKRSCALE